MLAIELPITNFSLLDSSQDASDIDHSPVIWGTTGASSRYSRPCARNRAVRSVKFIGAVPHTEASEFHVDFLRLKVRSSRYRGYENGTLGASTRQIRIHKTGNSHELTWVGRDATAVFSASDLNDLHTGSD